MSEIMSVVDMKRVGKIDADPKAVQAALEHLLASKTFARSAQLRRFLKLTVRKTLAGRSEDIRSSFLRGLVETTATSISSEIGAARKSFEERFGPYPALQQLEAVVRKQCRRTLRTLRP